MELLANTVKILNMHLSFQKPHSCRCLQTLTNFRSVSCIKSIDNKLMRSMHLLKTIFKLKIEEME